MASVPQLQLADSSFTPVGVKSNNSVTLPGRDPNEVIQTLIGISGGSLIGTGVTFRTNIEAIRNEYKLQISSLDAEIAKKRIEGVSDAEIRPWAIAERTRIARSMRLRQGPVATVVLEGRDYYQYGWGGRSEANLVNRALNSKKFLESGQTLDQYLIRGATSPNTGITEAALRAGKYLRFGGKILIPLGVGLSIYDVYKAAPEDRLGVAGEEASGWAGGALFSEGAVAAMLVLAPETGGLSLLGIALIAGIGGGALSGWGFHKLFFTNHPHAQASMEQTGTVPATMVQSVMPSPSPCPSCHSGH